MQLRHLQISLSISGRDYRRSLNGTCFKSRHSPAAAPFPQGTMGSIFNGCCRKARKTQGLV